MICAACRCVASQCDTRSRPRIASRGGGYDLVQMHRADAWSGLCFMFDRFAMPFSQLHAIDVQLMMHLWDQ